MLHKRNRRVATGGRATAGRRYHVPLLLLLCLTTSPATTVAVVGVGAQDGRVLRSFFGAVGVGSGGASVGVDEGAAASGSQREAARTAAKETLRRQKRGEFADSRTSRAVGAGLDKDGGVRERSRRVLLELRGGSEGLKSKAWVGEPAASNLAARTGNSETVDETGADGAKRTQEGSSKGHGAGSAAGALSRGRPEVESSGCVRHWRGIHRDPAGRGREREQ